MKSKFFKTLAVVAAAFALAFCLAGCGDSAPDNPNVGTYKGTTVEMLGVTSDIAEVYAEGDNYIEIKNDEKCTMVLDGQSIPATYTLDGEDIVITVEENGEKLDSPGTLKDGVISIDFCGIGMTMNFQKAA